MVPSALVSLSSVFRRLLSGGPKDRDTSAIGP